MTSPAEKRFGWWYLCIGVGFFLLALQRLLIGGNIWGIGIRLVVSAGFLWLGLYTLLKARNP